MDKTIALYMRLSDEDDNLAAHEESNSISHQRKLMLDHIQKLPELKDCNIMEFSDDGYSGADFSRPNFVKMMDLVKAGKIQVIVTKDYSRLGRDYLEVGNYMECIFPVLQVRYISVNDNYDSANSFKLAHKMIARREVTKRKPNGKWRKSYIRCGICGKGLYKYGNKSSYRCHNGHVSRIRGEDLEATLLDIARNMALAQLQEFELKTDGGNCPDNLEREIESLKKSKAHYAKLKFEIYDDYTKTNITRDQMAKKTAEVKQKIAEIESLITEKQETLDMQKDLFLDAKQEQLTKLSKLDEFDEEVIRYLIDYVLVYDNEHIEIRWNFDDFQAG